MRAVAPVESGHLQAKGFAISYEVFGAGDRPPVLLLPTWQIAPSLIWKMQVPQVVDESKHRLQVISAQTVKLVHARRVSPQSRTLRASSRFVAYAGPGATAAPSSRRGRKF